MFTTQELQSYLTDLKKLLSIETPTNSRWGMYRAVRFFINKAKQFNLPVTFKIYKYNKQAGRTLVITNVNNPIQDSFDVLVMAHLDTVYPKGTFRSRGFKIEGDMLKSPGAIDDKGPALMGLYALKHLDLTNLKFAYFLNNNEETGSKDNDKLIKELSNNAKYCINLEAARPNGSLVDQRMGLLEYEIHFSNAENVTYTIGDANNTFLEMMSFIQSIKAINNPYNGSYINFKIINNKEVGYTEVKNFSLGIQVRFSSHESGNKINENIKSYLSHVRHKNVAVNIVEIKHEKGLYLTPASIIFKTLVEEAGKKIGLKVSWQSSFGGADSVFVDNQNCATLDGFGPIGGSFHSADEYLNINSLSERLKLLVEVVNLIINNNKTNNSQLQIGNPEQLMQLEHHKEAE